MDDICAICLEKPHNLINLGCSHVFCYLCIKRAYISGNRKCPLCREDLDDDVYENAKGDNAHIKKGYHWLYSGRSDGWWLYDDETADEIEKGYEKYTEDEEDCSIIVEILGTHYIINFDGMLQINQYKPWKKRKIKRIDLEEEDDAKTIKGISGLMETIKLD